MKKAERVRAFFISTHDLTRRSTEDFENLVRSDTFQLTTSRGGRLLLQTYLREWETISTHDLTRRSTAISYNTTSFKIVFFVLILYF